jgi:hypothetical protein
MAQGYSRRDIHRERVYVIHMNTDKYFWLGGGHLDPVLDADGTEFFGTADELITHLELTGVAGYDWTAPVILNDGRWVHGWTAAKRCTTLIGRTVPASQTHRWLGQESPLNAHREDAVRVSQARLRDGSW